MPFAPEAVHVYKRVPGVGEQLVRTDYYMRFERRSGASRDTESFNAQGGKWYSNGGEPIATADVPDWVWAEVRAMDSGHRRLYRITLPEEQGKVSIPDSETAPIWPTDRDILTALNQLDSKTDTDWTADGRPALPAVQRVLGIYVTRARLNAVAPNFVRETLHDEE